MNCYYHKGHKYLEIDVDVGSSEIVTANLRLGLGCVMAVMIDTSFLVEAQSDEELLERLFDAAMIYQMEIDSVIYFDNACHQGKFCPVKMKVKVKMNNEFYCKFYY
ncbi:Protein of unknown function (DUF1336) [Abeliophyllum distichum]|uniref:Protein ENHANCED DISEASE RESISTANCE 2 C-terminal domain-containing protein n=1 Tax=Abeliophyllum distichum TaxID=126358 RepID=A0ABD1QIE0_9LAMI